MIPIPQDLSTLYNSLLIQKAVPEKDHPYYRKWLRYYLDFCKKYSLRQSDKKSLIPFIRNLKEKRQTSHQQKQAVDAISLYYGYYSAAGGVVQIENDAFVQKIFEITLGNFRFIAVIADEALNRVIAQQFFVVNVFDIVLDTLGIGVAGV